MGKLEDMGKPGGAAVLGLATDAWVGKLVM